MSETTRTENLRPGWKPGCSGKPKRRTRGSRNRVTLVALGGRRRCDHQEGRRDGQGRRRQRCAARHDEKFAGYRVRAGGADQALGA